MWEECAVVGAGCAPSTRGVPERWVWLGGHIQAGTWGFAEGEEEGLEKPQGGCWDKGESLGVVWRRVGPEMFCLRVISILIPSRFAPTHCALLCSALLWALCNPCLALSLQVIKSLLLRTWVPLWTSLMQLISLTMRSANWTDSPCCGG